MGCETFSRLLELGVLDGDEVRRYRRVSVDLAQMAAHEWHELPSEFFSYGIGLLAEELDGMLMTYMHTG